MFDRPVEDLRIDDIVQLVEVLKTPEGQFVDYKRQLETNNVAKKELVKDMSAFGNSQGGYLIVGVDEQEGIPVAITGTTKSVGAQKIDEWINSVVSANTDPKLNYAIKVIPHTANKVVIVIHIKDSPKKPHMNTFDKRNTYFRRHLDITSPATNQEVRDMFSESKSTQDKLVNFLDSRQLRNTQFNEFAQTHNAKLLLTDDGDVRISDRRFCLLSLIPAVLNDNLIDPVTGTTREWINTNTRGYQPIPSVELYRTHESFIDIDGITFPNQIYGHDHAEGYRSYAEFLNNGYVEIGVSKQLFGDVPTIDSSSKPILHLTNLVAIAHALVNFANKYYPAINYDDQIYLQISLHNVKGHALTGFDGRLRPDGGGRWASAYTMDYRSPPTLQTSRHIRIMELFTPSGENATTVDDTIFSIANQLSRAFGEEQVKCFDADRTYDPDRLRHINM